MILLILFFVFIIVYGMSFKEGGQIFLTKEKTVYLKGICSIEIVLGHIGLFTNSKILFPFQKAGVLVVGLFLLFSGYGLTVSYLKKQKKYLGTWKKRILTIFMPAFITYGLYAIVEFFLGYTFNPFIGFFIKTNWYIFEIIVLYALFFILLRYFDINKCIRLITLFSLIFVICAHYLGISNPWYGSTMCFPLGMYYAYHEKEIINKINRSFMMTVILTLLLTVIAIGIYFMLGNKYFISNVVARNFAAMTFSIFICILTTKVNIGNAITLFLGKISYEIYLTHLFILNILRDVQVDGIAMAYITILLTLVIAFILHQLINKNKKGRARG